MSDLTERHQEVQDARQRYEDLAAQFHALVRERLESGEAASGIARELGVTRSRVYQWARK